MTGIVQDTLSLVCSAKHPEWCVGPFTNSTYGFFRKSVTMNYTVTIIIIITTMPLRMEK
jgi:carbon starvation protein CstA